LKPRDIIQERNGKAKSELFEVVDRRIRPMMLTFILSGGKRASMSYAHLYRAELIAEGLHIEYSQDVVTIHGRNLDIIHRALTDHRLTFVREQLCTHHQGERDVSVKRIVVESKE